MNLKNTSQLSLILLLLNSCTVDSIEEQKENLKDLGDETMTNLESKRPLSAKANPKEGRTNLDLIQKTNPALFNILQRENIFTDQDILTRSTLSIQNDDDFTSLSGLEYFINLKALNIQDCDGVNDLSPLSELENLELLDVSNSTIENIDCLEKLKKLKNLNLRYSRAFDKKLEVLKNFKNLEVLNLHSCNLEDKNIEEVKYLNSLRKLDLGNNQITDLSILENSTSSLELLHIQNNQITNISLLSSLPKLNDLSIAGNSIPVDAKIPFLKYYDPSSTIEIKNELKNKNLALFETLDLENSRSLYEDITLRESVTIKNKSELTSLEGLEYFRALSVLDIRGCENLKGLEPLSNLVNLEIIIVCNSSIESISCLGKLKKLLFLEVGYSKNFDGEISVLRNFKKLIGLGLNGCGLTDENVQILSDLAPIKRISLGVNKITKLPPLEKHSFDIERLYLQGNQITDIRHLPDMPNLEELSFYENQITNLLALSRLNKLKILCLSSCNLLDDNLLPISNLKLLEEVYLVDNKITNINPLRSSAGSIKILNLKRNKINDLEPIYRMPNLKELYIKKNQLSRKKKKTIAKKLKGKAIEVDSKRIQRIMNKE